MRKITYTSSVRPGSKICTPGLLLPLRTTCTVYNWSSAVDTTLNAPSQAQAFASHKARRSEPAAKICIFPSLNRRNEWPSTVVWGMASSPIWFSPQFQRTLCSMMLRDGVRCTFCTLPSASVSFTACLVLHSVPWSRFFIAVRKLHMKGLPWSGVCECSPLTLSTVPSLSVTGCASQEGSSQIQ